MGHVLPQYHVKHDDFFETVSNKNSNFDSPEPEWKRLSGLVKNGNKKSSDTEGAMSPTYINNTTKLDDLSDINLSPDSKQDQREAGSNNQTETNPNHVHHQQETVLHGSEEEITKKFTVYFKRCGIANGEANGQSTDAPGPHDQG